MKFLFFLFIFLFVLTFSTVKSIEQGAWSKVYFLSMTGCEYIDSQTVCEAYGCQWYSDSCHTPPPANVTFTTCRKILTVGNYELCLTSDNKLIWISSSIGALGLIYIPLKKRRKEYE